MAVRSARAGSMWSSRSSPVTGSAAWCCNPGSELATIRTRGGALGLHTHPIPSMGRVSLNPARRDGAEACLARPDSEGEGKLATGHGIPLC